MKHKKHAGKSGKGEKKKKKSKDRKKDKRPRRESSSGSSSSSTGSEENVWVEKTVSPEVEEEIIKEEPLKREEWMNLNMLFPCVSNMSTEEKKKARSTEGNSILDKPGQSSRELNPYWKNGGSGLPQADAIKESREQPMDVNWLKKSLQRAKEQAVREGRSLEEIAAERWGSLETIQSMIDKAYSDKNTKYRRSKHRSRSRSRSRSRDRDRSWRYNKDEDFLKERRRKQMYKKPVDDDNYSSYTSSQRSHGSKKWQKESMREKSTEVRRMPEPEKRHDAPRTVPENNSEEQEDNDKTKILTEAEMNKLGARIVKAEIMGDTELASELKTKLEQARGLAKSSAASKVNESETVVLTRTDEKGIARPLEPRSQFKESSAPKKKKNVQTHASGERVRHYFDDDKYSLNQLFQREKGRSTVEDDAAFTKVVSKSMDMSDIFEEQISRAQSDARQDDIERARAINEHKRLTKSLDNCYWCVDSRNMLKHMIVTMDSKICLSLPSHVSLVEGHCILTPVQHIACQLQLDEDICESLKVFRKALCKMFADQDKYPVFFEMYKNRHKFPHMKLECIPLPREIGELAPIYFKKALLECETEWSVNKKVIDLKEKDVRQAIPNGLAYFAVQFANGNGYAHVIEDEKMFPRNFAEEIIGGMLDLDHDLWRKPRRENFDQQREKVLNFSEAWNKYAGGIKTDVN